MSWTCAHRRLSFRSNFKGQRPYYQKKSVLFKAFHQIILVCVQNERNLHVTIANFLMSETKNALVFYLSSKTLWRFFITACVKLANIVLCIWPLSLPSAFFISNNTFEALSCVRAVTSNKSNRWTSSYCTMYRKLANIFAKLFSFTHRANNTGLFYLVA